MKFTVISPIKLNGTRYEEGEVVDLKEEDASIAHCLKAADKAEKKAKAEKPEQKPEGDKPEGDGEGEGDNE